MSLQAQIEAKLTGFTGSIEFNVALSKVAYYRIGGPVAVLLTPKCFSDLSLIHQLIQDTNLPFFVLGWGSNLLFSDEGYSGIIIRMKHLFTEVEECGDGVLKVGASLGASSLLRIASERGYGGLSHLTGIPGSVGGMIAMNAGTHLGEMKDCLSKTEYVNLLDSTKDLTIHSRTHGDADFSYRRNHFLKEGDLITHAYLRFQKADPVQVKSEIEALYLRRKATQPVDLPSCGSVFMNPREAGLHAWQVIDRLGLRGHRIGNAQISEKHSNFIVNLGGATANDVRALIELCKKEALEKLSIDLHEEVRIL